MSSDSILRFLSYGMLPTGCWNSLVNTNDASVIKATGKSMRLVVEVLNEVLLGGPYQKMQQLVDEGMVQEER